MATSPPPNSANILHADLKRLKEENAQLRARSSDEPLVALLTPLLSLSGECVEALEREAGTLEGVAREMLMTAASMLRTGAISLFGEPNEIITVELPDPDYRLEGVKPFRGGKRRKGYYRVGRRGLRRGDITLCPVVIVPATKPCRGGVNTKSEPKKTRRSEGKEAE